MLNITVKITGADLTVQKLTRLRAALNNMPIAMKNIGQELSEYYRDEVFASEGGVYGEPWQALSKRYAAQKTREYPEATILIRTGDMQGGFRYTATGNTVFIDNSQDYWAKHQLGIGVPQRKIIGVNSRVRKIIRRNINKEIMKAIA